MARAVFAGTMNVVLSVEQSDEGMPGVGEVVGKLAPDVTIGVKVIFDVVAAIEAVDLGL